MKIHIAENYQQMSSLVADDVISVMEDSEKKLFCPASGDTPSGLFKELVSRSPGKGADLSAWHFIGLDEWVGMNGEEEGSCRDYLNRQLFHPAGIKEEQIFFFDGKTPNLENECRAAELYIKKHGGIKVCILGLGVNGHIAMNEPGTSPGLRSHISKISKETQESGQKYFQKHQPLTLGITLGIASIMEASHVFLLVSGNQKSAIVKKLVESEITNELPASLLKNHAGFRLYMDADAAAALYL